MKFEGSRGQKNNVLKFDQDLAGSLQDVEACCGKIPRANNFTKSSRILRGMSQGVAGKIREHANCHRFRGILTGSSWERDTRFSNVENCIFKFFYCYKKPSTLSKNLSEPPLSLYSKENHSLFFRELKNKS